MSPKRTYSKAAATGVAGRPAPQPVAPIPSGAQPALPILAHPDATTTASQDYDMGSPTRGVQQSTARDQIGLESGAPTPTADSPATPLPKRQLYSLADGSEDGALQAMASSPIAQAPVEMYKALVLAESEPSQPSLGQSLRAEVDELSLHQSQVKALQYCTCINPCNRTHA